MIARELEIRRKAEEVWYTIDHASDLIDEMIDICDSRVLRNELQWMLDTIEMIKKRVKDYE